MSVILIILGVIAGALLPFALIWFALWLAGTIGEIFDL